MAVITISRELGSEGDVIAEKVAQTLGYHLADKDVLGAVLNQYDFVDFGQEYDSIPSLWDTLDPRRVARREAMMTTLNRTILALAQHGHMVIVGRGSFAVLEGFADVFNVRIQAPLSLRVRRLLAQQKITDPDQAEALVKESDGIRAVFVETVYGVRWDSARAFDLVLNTGKTSPALAATWLAQIVQALGEQEGASGRTTQAIRADPILASAVSAKFNCPAGHRP